MGRSDDVAVRFSAKALGSVKADSRRQVDASVLVRLYYLTCPFKGSVTLGAKNDTLLACFLQRGGIVAFLKLTMKLPFNFKQKPAKHSNK